MVSQSKIQWVYGFALLLCLFIKCQVNSVDQHKYYADQYNILETKLQNYNKDYPQFLKEYLEKAVSAKDSTLILISKIAYADYYQFMRETPKALSSIQEAFLIDSLIQTPYNEIKENYYFVLGKVNAQKGDFKTSNNNLASAIQLIEKNDSQKYLKILNAQSSNFLKLKEFAKIDSVLTIADRIALRTQDTFAIANILFMHALSNNIQGNVGEAETQVLKSQQLFEKTKNKYQTIKTNRILAQISTNKGLSDISLNYYQKAIDLATELDLQHEIAILSFNLGNVYLDLNNFDQAKSSFLKSVELSKNSSFKIPKLELEFSLANIELEQDHLENALERYQNCIQLLDKSKPSYASHMSYINYSIGTIYSKTNQLKKAKMYLSNAEDDAIKINDTAHLNNITIKKGDISALEGNTNLAIKEWTKALEYGLKNKHFTFIDKATDRLVPAYIKTKNANLATKMFDLNTSNTDSMINQEKYINIGKTSAKIENIKLNKMNEFEIENLETKNEINTLKLKNRNRNFIYALLAILALSIMSFQIYRSSIKNKNLNTQLIQANQELNLKNEKLYLTNEIVENKNRELNESNINLKNFAYTAAHDIKAPLYTIFSMIESMRKKMNSGDGPVQEVISDNLNFLFKEADRLNHMIEDLLQLSTMNQHLPKPTKVNMNDIVNEVIQILYHNQTAATVDFQIGKLGTINAHPTLLRSLFQNLIINAIKFKSPDRPIHIKIFNESKTPDIKIIKIQDNGIGISEEYYDKIFEPFVRLSKNESGNGIGLRICKKVVELYNGKIWVESKENEGSTFCFTLNKLNMNI
jgi:signal transduction histidine kinase